VNLQYWLPFIIPFSSLLGGIILFFLKDEHRMARRRVNLVSALLKVGLVGYLIWGVNHGETYRFHFPLFKGFDLVLHADALSLLFVGLSATLWLVTTIYAVGYLEGSPNRRRFFGFFSLCVSATTGIALAGNLFTYLVFYELLTITTYPLVVHRGTPEALRAGRVYLAYTLTAGALLLLCMVGLSSIAGTAEFSPGGILAGVDPAHFGTLRLLFVLLVIGFGVKAAIVPFHGWLPVAMIAPAPVSALLHAVAVVKAGAFGIVRVVLDVYGIDFAKTLGAMPLLQAAAITTILYASVRALFQDDLKKRLAYSTVSQLSYITLGLTIGGVFGIMGGIVHLIHQGLMKITLFFCAGNLAEGLKISRVSQMNGVGRAMPATMAAFSIAALGMIGIPPMAGFITKWYLALGCLDTGQTWIIGVLILSSLLNAGYFLPPIYVAWFKHPDTTPDEEHIARWKRIRWNLLMPPLVPALLLMLAGLLANMPFSPLYWTRLIVEGTYIR
jgi:multicomponent Na+:H+ antiporter subunit D